MSYVAGVDGCKNGWFAVFLELQSGNCASNRFDSLRGVLESTYQPVVVAVDIPIGLLEVAVHGGRSCDRIARELLGQPRARSVFSPPVRQALIHVRDYATAHRANQQSSPENIGISKQCHALFQKIQEADILCRSKQRKRIFEVHPELCFYALNRSKPMQHGKKAKKKIGLEERRNVLRQTQFTSCIDSILTGRPPDVGRDDVLDAAIACWTSSRIASKRAVSIGDTVAKIWR
jgi:predicted RNase H-like nuclease